MVLLSPESQTVGETRAPIARSPGESWLIIMAVLRYNVLESGPDLCASFILV